VVLAAKVAAPVPTSGAEMAATAELERENAALVSRLDAATQVHPEPHCSKLAMEQHWVGKTISLGNTGIV
jgi:hypothetical protein